MGAKVDVRVANKACADACDGFNQATLMLQLHKQPGISAAALASVENIKLGLQETEGKANLKDIQVADLGAGKGEGRGA